VKSRFNIWIVGGAITVVVVLIIAFGIFEPKLTVVILPCTLFGRQMERKLRLSHIEMATMESM